MRLHQLVLLGALAAGLVCPIVAETLTLAPSDDMYSDPEHPGPHAADELWVANYAGSGHFQRIMVKFDLGGIEGPTIQSAMLHLYRYFVCPMDPYTVTDLYAITQNWDEDTWPEDQHVPHGTHIWAAFAFGPDNPAWYDVDITDLVQAWVDGELDNYGLVIQARNGQKWSKFYSKEHANPALRPYLDVDYTNTGVAEALAGNGPPRLVLANPSVGRVEMAYRLEAAAAVAIDIYDMQGRQVRNLLADYRAAGVHELVWDGRDQHDLLVPRGVYLCTLRTKDGLLTKKMNLLR